MKKFKSLGVILLAGILLSACADHIDPLSPGTKDGEYSIGMKTLLPIVIGNQWTYEATVFDTTGGVSERHSYTLTVIDTVLADTTSIPLTSAEKKGLKREALVWYLFRGDMGATTCWQVDTVENVRLRSADDTRFLEQISFDFRAAVNDTSSITRTNADLNIWGTVDTAAIDDSVRTVLVSKGADTLRTTLGSAPYFQYRQFYSKRTYYTDYYFKPGFGLLLVERFNRRSDGSVILARRDQLVSYYFK